MRCNNKECNKKATILFGYAGSSYCLDCKRKKEKKLKEGLKMLNDKKMYKENEVKDVLEKRSWKEFRESGLFWFINTTLHVFGWALTMEYNSKGEIDKVYPSRVKFRGFSEEINTEGYKNLSRYMNDNSGILEREANE